MAPRMPRPTRTITNYVSGRETIQLSLGLVTDQFQGIRSIFQPYGSMVQKQWYLSASVQVDSRPSDQLFNNSIVAVGARYQ